jgi:hypothetical protein
MMHEDYFMHYFWFTINDTVADANQSFDYQVSVGTNGTYNPDLFVSLMDGRWPTDSDYDMQSTMIGADSIRIASNMTIWDERGWNTSAGVVVVVGVKTSTPEEPFNLLLTSK